MNNRLYITGFCEIKGGEVRINDELCLTSNQTDLGNTLAAIIQSYNVVHPRFGKMDRLCQLGYTCVELLIQGRNLSEKYNPDNISLLFSNYSSSLDNDFKYYATTESIPSPSLFVYTLPNIMLAEICIKNKFKGENLFFISDSFDVPIMLFQIENQFKNSTSQACICGWVEVFEENYHGMVFLVEQEPLNEGFSIQLSTENLNALINN